MKWKLFITVCICFCFCKDVASEAPAAAISNGLIQTKLYLPDAEGGYYQGTRFDWSGNIAELEYSGHQYFSQWFPKYYPTLHEAILGPADCFDVIGFEQAEVGGEFLRIGVGGLKKENNQEHSDFILYPISNPGKWTVTTSDDHVVFSHEINDVAGYSYIYTKIVRLTKGKPEMVLEHTLKNMGKKTIKTEAFNHNFFTIDREPTGPNVQIRFPFEVSGRWNRESNPAVIEDNSFKYTRLLRASETVYMNEVQGHTKSVKDYDFRIENTKTNAGVRITCDRPFSKLVFWASSTTSCPEPYIDVHVLPEEQFSWTNTYEFYTF